MTSGYAGRERSTGLAVRSLFGAWCCAACLPAAPQPALDTLRRRVQRELAGFPNYVCTETVEQSRRAAGCPPGSRKPRCRSQILNRVRLDVGYADRKQIFGWTAGGRLSEEDISRLVPGLVSDGDLLTLSRLLLVSKAVFTGAGREERRGRAALRYDYGVPAGSSMWMLRYAWGSAATGYHGSLWIDRESLEPIELDMTADNVPASTGLRDVDRELLYARAQIATATVLLPERATIRTTYYAGDEIRTDARFDSCRQYTAASAIQFRRRDDLIAVAAAKRMPASRALPEADLIEADLALEAGIDAATAAVGDAATGLLIKPITDGRGVLIPKGAIFGGRITSLDFIAGDVEIAFLYVETRGRRIELAGRRNETVHISPTRWRIHVPKGYRVTFMTFEDRAVPLAMPLPRCASDRRRECPRGSPRPPA